LIRILFFEKLVYELGIDYIYVHPNTSILVGCAGLFPKSFVYNLAYLLVPKSPWNLFHDADITIPVDYFSKIDLWIQKNETVKWFLPYYYLYNMLPLNVVDQLYDMKDIMVGARLGGSLMISKEAFESVGGYDPELFCGWAPEDWFIVDKLSIMFGYSEARVNQTLFHVKHARGDTYHHYDMISHEVRRFYMTLRIEDAKKFINRKKAFLKMEGRCVIRETHNVKIYMDYMRSFQNVTYSIPKDLLT